MTRSKVQRRKDIDFSTLYYFLEARSMRSVCVVLENSKSCEILKMFLYRKIQTVRWRTEWSTSTQRVHPQIRGHRYHIPGHRTDPKINLFKSPQLWNTVWPRWSGVRGNVLYWMSEETDLWPAGKVWRGFLLLGNWNASFIDIWLYKQTDHLT